MLDKKSLTIVCLLLIVLNLTACGILSTPNTTPTHVLSTVTPTSEPAPTATAKSFAIKGKAFEAENKNHKIDCKKEVDVEVHLEKNGDLYFLFGGEMLIPLRGSDFVLWCYGAEHTWIGEATYAGYTFKSSLDDPLKFVVDRNKGYSYEQGAGTVTTPDGDIVTLP